MSEKKKLQGGKSVTESKTVQKNIISIVSSLGAILAHVTGIGTIPVIVAELTAIWGSIMSIKHRVNATEKIIKPGEEDKFEDESEEEA